MCCSMQGCRACKPHIALYFLYSMHAPSQGCYPQPAAAQFRLAGGIGQFRCQVPGVVAQGRAENVMYSRLMLKKIDLDKEQ